MVPLPLGSASEMFATVSFDEAAFEWVVPGLVAATPGIFVLVALLVNAGNAGIWLPLARGRLREGEASGRRGARRSGPVQRLTRGDPARRERDGRGERI